MTRPLTTALAEPAAVLEAVRAALSGDGPAVLPHPAPSRVIGSLPAEVPRKVAVVVETSGSTGRPKRVMLSADALLASAAATEVALGGPGQWLLALPAHYIAGVAVLVRSLTAQLEPVVMDPTGFDAQRFAAATARMEHPTRFVSLVPVQLARLLDSPDGVAALSRFERVLVGGQEVPAALATRAAEAGVALVSTYGSSETCGGCVYDGEPIGDTEVRVVEGRVELAGSVLAEGYLGDDRRTAFSFRDEGGKRWFRTEDAGELVDGRLRVVGRLDDLIVSGGVKVSLAEVERVVRGMPGQDAAVVVAAPHPEWGEAPVVVTDRAADLGAVRAVVVAELGAAAGPARIVLVDRLPLLESGKPDRLAIAALALR